MRGQHEFSHLTEHAKGGMAGMPRITGLLKRGPQIQASAVKNFSFTVSGQDSAKVCWSLVMGAMQIVKPEKLLNCILHL